MKKEIASGVTLYIVDSGQFKTNYVGLNFILPLQAETATEYALIPQVLKRGTQRDKDMTAVNKRLEELYGASLYTEVKKRGENQVVSIGLEFLQTPYALDGGDTLSQALEILCDIVFRPLLQDGAFCNEYVQSEKSNLSDQIAARINDKRSYAVTRLYQLMCAGEPFSLDELGSIEHIEPITAAGLYKAYTKMMRCAQVCITGVGKLDAELLQSKLSPYFEQDRTPAAPATTLIHDVGNVKEEHETVEVEQAKLSLGFRTGKIPPQQAVAANLFNMVLGGSATSKLFVNVREKLSLCYYCGSRLERSKSVMIVYSGIEQEKKEVAKQEILAQLSDICAGNITGDELSMAKKTLENAYRSMADSIAQVEDFYVSQLLNGSTDTLQQCAEKVADVTKDEIIQIASQIKLDTIYFLSAAK